MHLFTYGSLMLPEVMRALLTKDFLSERVTLEGFERFTLRGECYPGLVRSEGGVVGGRVYFELDPAAIELLDRFEDRLYERSVIQVLTEHCGVIDARAYIVPFESRDFLSGTPWSEQDFRERHLTEYTAIIERFRRKIASSPSRQGD